MSDLISRSELKKAFEDTVCIEPMPYAFVKQIIDNAPTVVNEKLTSERPQGEWLFSRCNLCGAYHNSMYRNFCPNCGADMRKGGAE